MDYTREYEGTELLVICNFSQEEQRTEIPVNFESGKILISNYEAHLISKELTLRPYEAVVLQA